MTNYAANSDPESEARARAQARKRKRQRIVSPFLNPDPIDWITTHFYIPELRGPIVLYPHQEQAIREALRRDDDGLFVYSTCIYSDIKKSAKSTIVAAIALYRAFQVDALDGWGSIYIIANDLKQADSRVAYYMRRAIELNPDLRAVCQVKNYKTVLPNNTFIEAIPIDPTGEAGSNADMVVFSELWGAHSKAQERMWTESTLPPGKFGKSQRWVETYAGFEGESNLLWNLYDQTVLSGQRLDPDLEIYANPSARLFALWNTRPRLPWQSEEYYAAERATLMPSEFNRVHRNQWSQGSQESYLPSIALWDACKESLPALDRRDRIVLGVDGAVGRSHGPSDYFALVAVGAHPTDRKRLAVRFVKAWQAKAGSMLDLIAIEQFIRWFWNRFAVQEVALDLSRLELMMQQLMRPGEYLSNPNDPRSPKQLGGSVYCLPFKQTEQRTIADGALLDRISSRGIVWDDTVEHWQILREHLSNADRKRDTSGEERKLRITKRTEKQHIDLAVALSMATQRATELLL